MILDNVRIPWEGIYDGDNNVERDNEDISLAPDWM